MFRKFSRLHGEAEAIKKMEHIFNNEYPKKGVLFALGNMQSRPKTFQLLGMIRVDKTDQLSLI